MTREKGPGATGIRTGASVLGAGLLVLAGMAPAAHARSEAASKYGGTFTTQGGGAPDCLDPQQTGLSASFAIFTNVVDSLVSIDPKGRYTGNLALKWKYSNGNKSLTFFLRHGVQFSNGDPFNAAAVKYTFARALDPALKSVATAADLKGVTSIQVVNPYTVRLNLSTPSRVLLTNLATSFTGILDPKTTRAAGKNTCQGVIGTGPFKIQSVGPAFSTVTLTRNERRNWNPKWVQNRGKAYLSKVVIKDITSPATAVSELLSGGLDSATVPGSELGRVKNNKNIALHRVLAQGENFVGFNFSHAPFTITAVRKAIAEAIDKKAILQAAYQNLGIVANSPLGKSVPFWDKNSSKYGLKFNPTAARQVLAANHVTGPFDLVIFQDPSYETAAQLIQAELGNVGVKINIVTKAPADYFPAVATGKFDLTALGYGYPDPDILYQLFNTTQEHGGLNLWNYSNPTVDTLLTQGRESSKKARSAYDQVQKILETQAVLIPLVETSTPFGIRTRIKGYQNNPSLSFPYQNLYVSGK